MKHLLIKRQDSHWNVQLNRPEKRNALSAELVEELIAVVDEAESVSAPAVVFQGVGKCFSAGFDMEGVDALSDGDLVQRFIRIETLLQKIYYASFLAISFAQGKNFGAGVDLAAVCHLRISERAATFRMPGLQFGIVLGTGRLVDMIGEASACQLLSRSETFDAGKALQLGFLTHIAEIDTWPTLLDKELTELQAIGETGRKLLLSAARTDRRDRDMAALVRSASEPGIKKRIQKYLSKPR